MGRKAGQNGMQNRSTRLVFKEGMDAIYMCLVLVHKLVRKWHATSMSFPIHFPLHGLYPPDITFGYFLETSIVVTYGP